MAKIPAYRLHKASGQGLVTIRGKDYYLGAHNTKESKSKYKRLIGEYLAQGQPLTFGQPANDLTVAELMADYLRFAKGYFGEGENSEFHRIKLVMKTLRALYGPTLVLEFGPLQYKATRETLACENGKHRTKPRTRQYINSAMKRLARMFKWGATEGRLPASIYESLRIIPGLKEGRCEAPESKQILPVSDVPLKLRWFTCQVPLPTWLGFNV